MATSETRGLSGRLRGAQRLGGGLRHFSLDVAVIWALSVYGRRAAGET